MEDKIRWDQRADRESVEREIEERTGGGGETCCCPSVAQGCLTFSRSSYTKGEMGKQGSCIIKPREKERERGGRVKESKRKRGRETQTVRVFLWTDTVPPLL